ESELGLAESGGWDLRQRFPARVFLQPDGGAIRSSLYADDIPLQGWCALLPDDEFRALRIRDSHRLKTLVSDFAPDIVSFIHIVQEPLRMLLCPLRVNCKLDVAERL